MPFTLHVISHSETETVQLAEKIGLFLKPGEVVVLTGELGSGKTVFVRGLMQALQIDESFLSSPSFTIINEYPGGTRPLYHFDLYRIKDLSELEQVGWDDYLRRDGILVVEWGEKADGLLPDSYYSVQFKIIDEDQREVDIKAIES